MPSERKRDGFTMADFRTCAKSALMKRGRAEAIVEEVQQAMKRPNEAPRRMTRSAVTRYNE
jgi:hypothetical protein